MIGRFTQEDTYRGEIPDPQSLNLYAYVQNNPIKYIDPSGHIKVKCGVDNNWGWDIDWNELGEKAINKMRVNFHAIISAMSDSYTFGGAEYVINTVRFYTVGDYDASAIRRMIDPEYAATYNNAKKLFDATKYLGAGENISLLGAKGLATTTGDVITAAGSTEKAVSKAVIISSSYGCFLYARRRICQ